MVSAWVGSWWMSSSVIIPLVPLAPRSRRSSITPYLVLTTIPDTWSPTAILVNTSSQGISRRSRRVINMEGVSSASPATLAHIRSPTLAVAMI